MPEVAVYCMSKASTDMFTQCLSLGMYAWYTIGRLVNIPLVYLIYTSCMSGFQHILTYVSTILYVYVDAALSVFVLLLLFVVATNVTADDDDDENGDNYADTSVFTDDYVDAAASFVCVTDADDSAVAHKTNVDPVNVNVRVILYIIFSLLYTPFWW